MTMAAMWALRRLFPLLCALTLSAWSSGAAAHSFGRSYSLPLPFWMYGWGAGAVLLISFLLLAAFSQRGREPAASKPVRWRRLSGWRVGQCLSVMLLALCVLTGWWGNPSPYANFNMTAFWVIFVVGLSYLTVVIGDVYCWLNPWRAMSEYLGACWPAYRRGWLKPSPHLGYWPAVLLYAGFIALELLGRHSPAALAWWLATYSLLNLVGAGVVGPHRWYARYEFFGVYFGLLGRLAPVTWRHRHPGLSWRLRAPGEGVLRPVAGGIGLLVFVLFMLSSTAFDGLKETLIWHRWYWVDLYHAWWKTQFGSNPLAAYPLLRSGFVVWNALWLWLSPMLYLCAFGGFVLWARRLTGTAQSWQKLALAFGLTLLPIAVAYHAAHYYTMLQTQGVRIVALLSDPFGWGWNLLGTANWLQRTIVPDPATVWHAQLGLIVGGHVWGVVLSHRMAQQLFASRRQVNLSQIPLLLLMVIFTVVGLWVLSQPLARAG